MKPKNKIPDIVFYQNLGELFYAIAAADKVVKTEEYKTLIEMIVSDWKIYDTINEFYNEADGYQIENIFNLLNYKKLDAQICFNNFREYARAHSAYFSKEKIELIYKTAHAIASSFSSKNKSELIMLANLELLFKESIFNN